MLRQNFITWLIAHEVGHAVLHHDYILDKGEALHFDQYYDAREREADWFVAMRLAGMPAISPGFDVALIEFIEQEYRREYLNSKVTTETLPLAVRGFPTMVPLSIDYTPYTMPLLLRAVRIFRAYQEHAEIADRTGYMDVVELNITVRQPASKALVLTCAVAIAMGGLLLVPLVFRAAR